MSMGKGVATAPLSSLLSSAKACYSSANLGNSKDQYILTFSYLATFLFTSVLTPSFLGFWYILQDLQ